MKYKRKANKIGTEINRNCFGMEKKIEHLFFSDHTQGNNLLRERDEF